MLQHAFLSVGRDDGKARTKLARDVIFVSEIHRSWVERGDLVVVEIGGDESLRGELPRDLLEERRADVEAPQALEIRTAVLADGSHQQRRLAEKLQVVRNVSRRPAELATHLRRQKAHVEDVQLVGQQMVSEAIREYHDRVVGDRAGDE